MIVLKSKKNIGMLFPNENIPRIDENRIEQTVLMGQDYIERNVHERTPILSLFYEQVKYISPLLWVTQFFALIIVFSLAVAGEPNLYTAQNILFQIAPLTALLAVPELIKDSLYNMTELERSCKNSGSVILLMRLIAVGCINIITLSLFVCIFAGIWDCNFFSLILYALVPYNCVNVISLGVIHLFKIKGRSAARTVSLLSAVILFVLPIAGAIASISVLTMLSVFIGTTVVLTVQIIKVFRAVPTGGFIAWN